jgi:7-keto-8-aminopelargonate synthetase-like enzyme
VDGAFLSGGKIERFRHNDMAHLERVLSSLRKMVES